MKSITLPFASKLTSPNPVSLICSEKTDGSTNLATVSWWTYLSFDPDTIGFAMAKTSYTGERVRETRKVILTIPGTEISEAVMGCGRTTGHNTDKATQFAIELMEIEGGTIKIPVHSRVAILCELKEFVEAGDHYFYICTVEKVYGNPDEEALFTWKGYSELHPAVSK